MDLNNLLFIFSSFTLDIDQHFIMFYILIKYLVLFLLGFFEKTVYQ
jgi:hypothetical protein